MDQTLKEYVEKLKKDNLILPAWYEDGKKDIIAL